MPGDLAESVVSLCADEALGSWGGLLFAFSAKAATFRVFSGLRAATDHPSRAVCDRSASLSLSEWPQFAVSDVEVSVGGRLLLWAAGGVAVVTPPADLSSALLRDEFPAECSLVDAALFESRPSLRCLRVRCCPNHDARFGTLCDDGVLRIYNVAQPESPLVQVTIVSDSPVRRSLGETPVSFDFGDEDDGQVPAYVLLANGDIFTVHFSADEFIDPQLDGPLRQSWADESYAELDFADVVCFSAAVPILVTGTATGRLAHCLIIKDADERACVHVYEQLSLPESEKVSIGAFSAKDAMPGLCFVKECGRLGYLVSHPGGLHSVRLPWAPELSSGRLSSTAESAFLVASPSLGSSCVVGRSAVALTPDGLCLRALRGAGPAAAEAAPAEESESFLDAIQGALRKDASVPQLRGGGAESEEELSRLAVRVLAVLRSEYVAKLRAAKQLAQRKVETLNAQLDAQREEGRRLLARWEQASAASHAAKERSARAQKRQDSVLTRLANVQSGNGAPLSAAEEEHVEHLRRLQAAMGGLRVKLGTASASAVAAGRRPQLSPVPLGSPSALPLRRQLEKQNDELEELADKLSKLADSFN